MYVYTIGIGMCDFRWLDARIDIAVTKRSTETACNVLYEHICPVSSMHVESIMKYLEI